jgi:dolichyl-phosphate beta-glucosyltransferase
MPVTVTPRPYLSIILPAYNEARAIGSTLEAMRAFLDAQDYEYQIVVASDGDDETPEIVKRLAQSWDALTLVAERGRHGKGHGLRRGMAIATGAVVGFIDADYKTPIDEVAKVLPWFKRGYDLVVGSRTVAGASISRAQPLYRTLGGKAFGIVVHAILGLRNVHDTQCGFKFFTAAAASEIFSRSAIDGYMCDVEILWLAEQLNYRVKEVGIVWRDDGDSRLELVSGNLRNARDVLRIRFARRISSAPRTARQS